jgi:FkbM family methyltransferase
MKILFVLKQSNYFPLYSGLITTLTERGHSLRVAWPEDDAFERAEPVSLPVSRDVWHPRRSDEWADLASFVRRLADYVRYLDPGYSGATKLRARAFDKLLETFSYGARRPSPGWSDIALACTAQERERVLRLSDLIERSIPSDPAQEAFIESDRPDVVLVCPLIDLGSAQTDVIKSARRLGIPTGMVLYSWDNLSTKGGLHIRPDRMFVWNEVQRQEALTLHGYPLEQSIATGAPRFDEFFRLVPVTDRASFHAPLGLDPDRPTLLYLGSSKFVVTTTELPFIREWVRAIRGCSDDALRRANIIIRPHPDVKEWDGEGEVEQVVWTGQGGKGLLTRPIADRHVVVLRTNYRRAQAFYDALHHSTAVVGLNTSAALEAAIVGRPVFTIIAGDEVADGQSSTLHFHYLLERNGGCVSPAVDFREHVRQLSASLAGPRPGARLREFARSFVRPMGLDVPASDVLAAAIEREFTGAAATRGESPLTSPATSPSRVEGDTHPPTSAAPPAPGVVRLDFPKTDIWLHATSATERRVRAKTCRREPWSVEWLRERVRREDVFYDIGANVGIFALIAAKHIGALVVAFEPGYANFARLCENVQLNDCFRAIVPVPLPLGEKAGMVGFKYRSLEPGQSRHALLESPWEPRAVLGSRPMYIQPVCAMTLDAAVEQFALPSPHHMRIDVDGAELRVLQGAGSVLAGPQLRTILLEVEQKNWEPVCAVLKATGFDLRGEHARKDRARAPTSARFERD